VEQLFSFLKVICDVLLGVQSLIFLELVNYSLLIVVLVRQLQLLSVPQELLIQRQDITAIRHYDVNEKFFSSKMGFIRKKECKTLIVTLYR